jgi:hypothetical protein
MAVGESREEVILLNVTLNTKICEEIDILGGRFVEGMGSRHLN